MQSIYTTEPTVAASEHIAKVISEHLHAGQKVTWIISGGSGMKVVLKVAELLATTNLSNLRVTLSDERFGPVGHPDENWQQLLDAGFSMPGALLYRPLSGADQSTTTRLFDTWLAEHITTADFTIGLFGIGSDGHTAGIKPHSSAAIATSWADSYTGNDFERITMTPYAIRGIDEAVTQASGLDKVPALRTLLHETVNIKEQPAQILKVIPVSTLYSDNKEI